MRRHRDALISYRVKDKCYSKLLMVSQHHSLNVIMKLPLIRTGGALLWLAFSVGKLLNLMILKIIISYAILILFTSEQYLNLTL